MDSKITKVNPRGLILHEFKLNRTPVEGHKNIVRAWGPKCVSLKTCRRWFDQFNTGDFNIDDKPRSGRPSEIDDQKLKDVVEENPLLSSYELAEQFYCSHTAILNHLESIGKVSKLSKWVPHKLSEIQKQNRMTACLTLYDRLLKDSGVLKRITTGDEKWVLYVNVKRQRQWCNKDEDPKSTPKDGLHPRKVMLSVWWDIYGVVHFELLDPNTTINAELYCQQLDRVCEAIEKTRPHMLDQQVVLLHDNARPHTARLTVEKVRSLGWECLPHPAYSPDLAPSDYFLFRNLQTALNGHEFPDNESIYTFIKHFFDSKDSDWYRNGIYKLPGKWEWVLDNGGDYIIE